MLSPDVCISLRVTPFFRSAASRARTLASFSLSAAVAVGLTVETPIWKLIVSGTPWTVPEPETVTVDRAPPLECPSATPAKPTATTTSAVTIVTIQPVRRGRRPVKCSPPWCCVACSVPLVVSSLIRSPLPGAESTFHDESVLQRLSPSTCHQHHETFTAGDEVSDTAVPWRQAT